jgi:hypothetical protein
MVKLIELKSRIKEHYKFPKPELISILIVIFISAIVFGFDDGKDIFNLSHWLGNLFLIFIFITISFVFRLGAQKIYSLNNGQLTKFILWWPGLIISFVLALLSNGLIKIIIPGFVNSIFMTRYRLGEYRYGFSYKVHSTTILWGIIGHLIMAIVFSLLNYYLPLNAFLMAVYFNLIMAFVILLPLPKIGGLDILLGSRVNYVFGWVMMVLATVFLIAIPPKIGLTLAITIGSIIGIFYFLTSA